MSIDELIRLATCAVSLMTAVISLLSKRNALFRAVSRIGQDPDT